MKCPRCSQEDAYIYTEDFRKKIRCVACGFVDYLRGNKFNKPKQKTV